MAEFRAWQKGTWRRWKRAYKEALAHINTEMVQDAAALSDEELVGIDPEAVFTKRAQEWPT